MNITISSESALHFLLGTCKVELDREHGLVLRDWPERTPVGVVGCALLLQEVFGEPVSEGAARDVLTCARLCAAEEDAVGRVEELRKLRRQFAELEAYAERSFIDEPLWRSWHFGGRA